MEIQFEDSRNELLKQCEVVANLKFSNTTLSMGTWVEALRETSGREIIDQFKSDHPSIDKSVEAIRHLSSKHFTIQIFLLSRLLLIQNSCSKILSSWTGVSSEINEFRFMTERYVTLIDLLNKFEDKTGALNLKNQDDLHILGELIAKAGFTRFNWDNQPEIMFENMKETTYKLHDDSEIDLTSKSIMNLISRVEKSGIKGLRAFYSFCCEFTHPNMGDFVSCSFDVKCLKANDGGELTRWQLSPLSIPNIDVLDGEYNKEDFFVASTYLFMAKIIEDLNKKTSTVLNLIKQSNNVSSKWTHKAVKFSNAFDKSDLCPCGSGFSIKVCVAKSGRLKSVK